MYFYKQGAMHHDKGYTAAVETSIEKTTVVASRLFGLLLHHHDRTPHSSTSVTRLQIPRARALKVLSPILAVGQLDVAVLFSQMARCRSS